MRTEEDWLRAWDELRRRQAELEREVQKRCTLLRIVRDTGKGYDEVLQIVHVGQTPGGVYVRVR